MNDGGPAFPVEQGIDISTGQRVLSGGMSLRDWFAGQALMGIIAGTECDTEPFELMSKDAYKFADAMIKAKEGSL